MTEQLVPTVRTTPTMLDFARALLAAWPEATKAAAGVLYAQFAGETGDGKHCYNHNLGNVKWTKGSGLDFVALVGVWEGFRVGDEDGDGDIDDDDRAMLVARMVATGLWAVDTSADHAKAVGASKVSLVATKANTTTWFRAYPSLADGMAAFVKMKRNELSRYASTWRFVLAGDCDAYARELGRLGYFTADPGAYSRAMQRKHAVWMASDAFDEAAAALEPAPPSSLPSGPPDDETRVVDAVVRPRVPLGRPRLDG